MNTQNESVNTLHDPFIELVAKTDEFIIDFDEAWQWIGYASKQMGEEMLRKNFIQDDEFSILGLKTPGQKGGRPATHIMLTVDCFKAFCMLAQTEQGKQVRRYYIRLEKEYYEMRTNTAKRLDPVDERRQLLTQIKEDDREARRLELELQDVDLYQQYVTVTERIVKNKARLKGINSSTVNQLNLLAERTDA
jgi:phage anti-repressor protein